jgi:hypothetical protein
MAWEEPVPYIPSGRGRLTAFAVIARVRPRREALVKSMMEACLFVLKKNGVRV